MLILVRHGQTAHNASRRLLGRLDVPLDELGGRQARAMGRAPDLHRARRVVSSPLGRARDTAEAFGLPVTVDDRWAEIDYGIYDGMPLADVPPSVWESWAANLAWAPEGGESLAAVGARVSEACDDLWAEAQVTDVVVVSHVSPIKAAVAWALAAPPEAIWRMFVAVASVSRVGVGRGGAPSLHSFNETRFRPDR